MPEITLDHLKPVARSPVPAPSRPDDPPGSAAPTLRHGRSPTTPNRPSLPSPTPTRTPSRMRRPEPQPSATARPAAEPTTDSTTATATPVPETEPELAATHVAPDPSDEEDGAHQLDHPVPPALVHPMPIPAPRILVLGPVDVLTATGKVEPTKRSRLLEYAAYLSLPPGTTHTAIDNAIWPDRKNEDNLTPATPPPANCAAGSVLTPSPARYLPRLQGGGLRLPLGRHDRRKRLGATARPRPRT
jgi:hypothetical protein